MFSQIFEMYIIQYNLMFIQDKMREDSENETGGIEDADHI